MLSISHPRTASGATSYYLHMEKDSMGQVGEYYAKVGEAGYWLGDGANRLCLDGALDAATFKGLCEGFGKDNCPLLRNAGDPDRRAGLDLTFSAPKSVSVAWSVADELTRLALERAHAEAVRQAFGVMQEHAAYGRTGAQGRDLRQAELIGAAFQHGTSREQDAQLHTHVFVMNLALIKGRSPASIESALLYDYKMAVGAAYQCGLAHELGRLGYQVERDGHESFRIANVPRSLEDVQSTRRQQIEAELARTGQTSAKAAARATLATRKAKVEPDLTLLRAEWAAKAQEHGFTPAMARPSTSHVPIHEKPMESHHEGSEQLTERRRSPVVKQFELRQADSMPSARDVLDKATEHDALITKADMLRVAYRLSITAGSARDAEAVVARSMRHSVAVERIDGGCTSRLVKFTTRELMQAERDVLRIAVERRCETRHMVRAEAIEVALARTAEVKGYQLNEEQCAAVEKLAGTPGGVLVMVGDAGTGKSSTMYAIREAHEAAGMRVIGTSSGGKASAELMASSGIDSRSIAKLQSDLRCGREQLNSRTVLVIDEAGMTSSRDMAALMRAAGEAGTKLILVGDWKQLQPVGAGETFRAVDRELGSARLEQINRQVQEWERDTVKELSRGEAAKALKTYDQQGRIHIVPTYQKAISDLAVRHVQNMRDVGPDKAVALAGTRQTVDQINEAVRAELKRDGKLGDGMKFTTKDEHRNIGTRELELAKGDRVMIGTTDICAGYISGDTGRVVGLDTKVGMVEVNLNRTGEIVKVSGKNAEVRHGYAMTTHKSQGSTYERAIVYLDRNCSREMAYVQASRAKEQTDFVATRHVVKEMQSDAPISESLQRAVDRVADARQAAGRDRGMEPGAMTCMRDALDYIQANKDYAPRDVQRAAKDAQTMQALATAMGRERPKETTLDYRLAAEGVRVPTSYVHVSKEQEFSKDMRQLERALIMRERDLDENGRGHSYGMER